MKFKKAKKQTIVPNETDPFLARKNFFISSEGNYSHTDMTKEMTKNLTLLSNKAIILVNYLPENPTIRAF